MRIARVAGSALHGHCLVHSENARIGEADRLRLFLYDDATTAMVVGMDKGAGAQRLTIDVRRETRAETRRRETMRQCGFANVSSSHVSARLASIVSRLSSSRVYRLTSARARLLRQRRRMRGTANGSPGGLAPPGRDGARPSRFGRDG